MKKIAISVGDVNGVGLEIMLKAHNIIKEFIKPIYIVDYPILESASKMLDLAIPNDLEIYEIKDFCSKKTQEIIAKKLLIKPGVISKESGEYSFTSFKCAIDSTLNSKTGGVLTLPIHKLAWHMAGIEFLGHTEYLSARFGKKGIMMLGCKEMFVALFSDHIPLKSVSSTISLESVRDFLLLFYNSFKFDEALVLGLNPHAGDGGILGDEDSIINEAIKIVNEKLKRQVFFGAISPDAAFAPHNRKKFSIFIAMYHDQGLAPLKALYFDKSINVTLGLPISRASVDHGVAFDIAYKDKSANIQSYVEAARFLAD